MAGLSADVLQRRAGRCRRRQRHRQAISVEAGITAEGACFVPCAPLGFLSGLLMAVPVRACALVGRFVDPRVAESASTLLAHLKERQIQVLVSEDAVFPSEVSGVTRVSEREIGKRIDLIVAIGGDGTLLYAAGLVARDKVPLLGINRGRLGFLTDVLPQDMIACVDDAIDGRLEADERPLLWACLYKTNGTTSEGLALN